MRKLFTHRYRLFVQPSAVNHHHEAMKPLVGYNEVLRKFPPSPLTQVYRYGCGCSLSKLGSWVWIESKSILTFFLFEHLNFTETISYLNQRRRQNLPTRIGPAPLCYFFMTAITHLQHLHFMYFSLKFKNYIHTLQYAIISAFAVLE